MSEERSRRGRAASNISVLPPGERVASAAGEDATATAPDEDAAPRLSWTAPDGASRSLALGANVTIGRVAGNDIILRDPAVSRHHATITAVEDGQFVLADPGSSNGTTLNDRPLEVATALRSGDRIGIGATVLTVSAPDSFAAQTPPRVVATALASDGSTMIPLNRTAAGWLELPGGERRILGGETRIGRAAKNDITIEDTQISRNHAHIRRIDNGFVISDLGSANGVRVNGEPVLTPRALADGDRIELGTVLLRFSLAPFDESEAPTGETGPGLRASATSIFSLDTGGIPAALKGDLREVTILFADLHGFTAMSERLNNPEQTTFIINQVFERLTAEIVRYDGSIDKYTGDNIMALFGAPRAHEDDPERAIKAALAMQRALEHFNRRLRREIGLRLRIRIGVNTGEVLFGQVGGGAFRSYTVMGDAVNLASRLEHAARVDHILVGEATHRRTMPAFHFTALPPLDIKGKREPVHAYEVVREKRADEILREPAGGDYLIGREHELEQMRAALEEARAGQGRLLAVIGDAGIGKSQLLAAFRRAYGEGAAGAEDEVATDWIVERCLSYEATAPYALLSGLLRSLLALDCDEPLDRAKLLAALNAILGNAGPGQDETRAEYLALLGQILGVTIDNAYIAGLEAKMRRALTTAMIRALVAARVYRDGSPRHHRQALVLVLEEMQWADGASVDALDELVEALPELPVLLLLTYRPEWVPPWAARPALSAAQGVFRAVRLAELSAEQSRRFLAGQLPGAELPDALADGIYAQCGGNPLLLAETVKSLRERRALAIGKGRWTLTSDAALLEIPSTLRSMMLARLDRLAEQDRAVLQRAAVIGRSFTYRLLALVTGLGEELDDSLARLKEQEFITENPLATEPEFSFRHTVVQEIAYGNVLAAERRALHGRIGEALEQIGGDRVDDQLEVLAHHYSRSGAKRKAVEYLTRSGEKARRLYANETAIAQFEEALEKLRSLPAGEVAQGPTRPLQLHETLGDVRLLTADFRRAQEQYEAGLAEAAGATADKARLWNKLGTVWERRGDYRKALGSYDQGLAVLGPGQDAAGGVLARLQASAARAHAHRGEYAAAGDLATKVLAGAARPTAPDERRVRADALHVLGLVAYAAGRPDEALERHLASLELRQESGDTLGMQESYHELGAIYWSRGQLARAFEHLVSLTAVLRLDASDLKAIAGEPGATAAPEDDAAPLEHYYRGGLTAARQVGDLWGVAISCNRLGNLLYRQGEHERALGYLRTAIAEAERIGARELVAQASINLGAIMVARGHTKAGMGRLERGIAYAEAVESGVVLAEGEARLAEGLLRRAQEAAGDLDAALAAARRALATAERVTHRFTLGLAHRALGRVATARADWTTADRHFRQALDLFNGLDAQAETGRTLGDFAAMWRAWSDAGNGALPAGAATMLRQAVAIFTRLEMRADLAAARAALPHEG